MKDQLLELSRPKLCVITMKIRPPINLSVAVQEWLHLK